MSTRNAFIAGCLFSWALFAVLGCTPAQKQQVDASIDNAAALVVSNGNTVTKDVSLGTQALLNHISVSKPDVAKNTAKALQLWAQASQQVLSGNVDIAGDAWAVLQAGLGSKIPPEANAIVTMVNAYIGSAGSVNVKLPLSDLKKKALSVIMAGVEQGATANLNGK